MAKEYLDKAGLTYFWGKVKAHFIKGNTGGVFYGTCTTGASATAKAVTCADFVSADLKEGTTVWVKFSNTNSGAIASLTLNVNSTGAKAIKFINNGTKGNLPSAGYLKASTTYPFTYDGSSWVCAFNYNTTYSSMTDAEITAGTGTSARIITPARLKSAIQLHAPVTSVNGETGDVTVTVPTKTSDLTNDSGFITNAPVTSVNGETGDVTIDVPTSTSQLVNDSDYLVAGVIDDYLTPMVYATDAVTKAVLSQAFDVSVPIRTPKDFNSILSLMYGLNPRMMYAWMNGSELEMARVSVDVDTSTNVVTLYLKGKNSIATGRMGYDDSWTVTALDGYYEASWTATASSATGTQLTDSITVPKGTYLISLSSPYVQTATALAGIRVNSATDIGSMMTLPVNAYTKASFVMTFDSDSTIYALTQSSASCTFTNINRGSLKAVKLI